MPIHSGRSTRNGVEVDPTETEHCQRLAARFDARDDTIIGPSRPEASSLPPELRRAARTAGIDGLLVALGAGEGDASAQQRLQLVTRISSLEIQLDAVLFEADCVGDQLEAVIHDLDARQHRREVALTVSSILVGAAAAVGAGVWELRGNAAAGPPVISIAGGTAAAGLGLAAFLPGRPPVTYRHARNLLAPIFSGEDPDHLYPTFVFQMLTTPMLDGGRSPRDALLDDWRRILDEGVRPEHRAIAREVLFGGGGTYDAALVDVRERMFDALESHLNSIERDLELLYRYSERLIAPA